MFTLISAAIGGGILCLPYVFSLVGLVAGLLLLSLSAVLAYISMRMLFLSAARTGIYSYGKLFANAVEMHMAGPFLDVITISFGVGVVIAYFVFLGDFIPSLFYSFGFPVDRVVCILVACVAAIPLVVPYKLSALQNITPFSTVSLIFTAGVVVYRACTISHETSRTVSYVIASPSLFKAFAICISSFICHTNVVAVAGELVAPTTARSDKIALRAAVVQLALYVLISVCGYISFGEDIQQNFIRNYPPTDVLITACRAMLSLTILCGIPINTNPTAKAFVNLLNTFRESNSDEPLLPATPSENTDKNPQLRIGTGVAVLVLAALVSLTVPGVADVIGILGGSFGTLIMLVFPAIIYARVFRQEMCDRENQIMVLLLLTSAGICFTSFGLSIAGSV